MFGRKLAYLAILLMFVLHQDFWLWGDPTLLLGFLPVGLAYHALYSVAVAMLWFFVVRYAWPHEWETFAQPSAENSEAAGRA